MQRLIAWQILVGFRMAIPEQASVMFFASLAHEEPQHPPLYFLVRRLLSERGSSSVFQRRLPAAIFATLMLPAIWWLTFELFRSRATAWLATSFLALSPFHVAYAQQDREYSLWALAIIVSSSLLLRALRLPSKLHWIHYASAVTVSLWAYTLSLYVLLAHALFIFIGANTGRANRWSFALASGSAVLLFFPWMYIIATNSATISSTTAWDSARLSAKVLAAKWLFNGTSVFFDLDYLSLRFLPVVVLIVVIAVLATSSTIRNAPAEASRFIMIMGGISMFTMLIPDLVLGQSHSTESRYLTPLWISIELAVSYGIVASVRYSRTQLSRSAWRFAGIFVLACGAASCLVSSQAQYWWLASDAKTIPAIARVLDSIDNGGLIALSTDDFYLLELSNLVRRPIRFHQVAMLRNERSAAGESVYVIGKPSQLGTFGEKLKRQEFVRLLLAKVFPQQDASITSLRAEGAAIRNTRASLDEIAIWSHHER